MRLSYDLQAVGLHDEIRVRDAERTDGELVETTVGRVIFDSVVPDGVPFSEVNKELDKRELKRLISTCYRLLGRDETARMAGPDQEHRFRVRDPARARRSRLTSCARRRTRRASCATRRSAWR